MNGSVFTFLISVFWFNAFIIFVALLRKNDTFIQNFSIMPVVFIAEAGVLRLLCFCFELPNTFVISSKRILPAIIDLLERPLFTMPGEYVLNALNLFCLVWIAGSLYCIFRILRGWLQGTKGLFAGEEVSDPQIITVMEEIAAKSNQNAKVRIVRSPEVTIPMVYGFFRPTIYLPELSFTAGELRNILTHEWTHFVHKDAWIKLFVCLLQAVFWWNPFVHILKSNLDPILEIRCDFLVTARMCPVAKESYLASILKVVEHHLSAKSSRKYGGLCNASFLISLKKRANIEQRFQLVQKSQRQENKPLVLFFYTIFLVVFIASNMVVAQPVFESPNMDGGVELMVITPQNAFLKPVGDNAYALYVDGEYFCYVDGEQMQDRPFCLLPIK